MGLQVQPFSFFKKMLEVSFDYCHYQSFPQYKAAMAFIYISIS